METTQKRHGFITFWLWLGIIVNIISTPIGLISLNNIKNLGSYGMQMAAWGVNLDELTGSLGTYILIWEVILVISAILAIIGFIKLLNWKKFGFWLNACVSVVSGATGLIMAHLVSQEYAKLGMILDSTYFSAPMTIFNIAVGILVLWAVLQIRKNGVSYWKQLE